MHDETNQNIEQNKYKIGDTEYGENETIMSVIVFKISFIKILYWFL